MRDLAFYNAGCLELRGLQRLTVPFRRLVRYLLRPIFYRQVELFQELQNDLATMAGTQQQLLGEIGELSQALSRLRTDLEETRTALQELRRETAPFARRLERLEGLEEDHLALTRRLATLEDCSGDRFSA